MSNNKQTAVEWLFEKLWETPKDKLTWYSILEKAKQMENKQSIFSPFIKQLEKIDKKINDKFNNISLLQP